MINAEYFTFSIENVHFPFFCKKSSTDLFCGDTSKFKRRFNRVEITFRLIELTEEVQSS